MRKSWSNDRGLTNRRPRVLMISGSYPPADRAGMERGCERLSQALARRGYRVTVLTRGTDASPRDARDEAGVRVLRVLRPVSIGPLWGISYMWQVAGWMLRLLRSWDFALCHQLYLHSAIAVIIARLTRRRSASLLVAAQTYSDIDRLLRLRGGRALTWLALKTDVVFALSGEGRRELREAGVSDQRVLPYHYFVDPQQFASSPLGHGAVLISIGRFDPQKNLPLLVRAFECVHREVPNARLRLIGHGPSEDDLRRLVAASPARDAVSIESWTDDPAAAYRAARAVVMSSDAEGLSNVLLEAMASGRPVVTTDVSGAREALALDGGPIRPGETRIGRGGILVPLGDSNALAVALLEILRNDQLAATLAAAARARVVEAFSEEASVRQFLHGVATADRLGQREPTRWD